jgi:hypothetical protein
LLRRPGSGSFHLGALHFVAYLLAISSVAAEIEAIRAGKWDVKIEKDLGVDETTPDRPSPSPSPQSEVCPSISSMSQELSYPDL